MNMQNITGLVKDMGQLLIGVLVEETDTTITLKNASMLGISNNGAQTNIQFIPLDLLSMQPPIGLKNVVKNTSAIENVTFKKESLLYYNLELQDTVVENYKTFSGLASQGSNVSEAPVESAVVKLFD